MTQQITENDLQNMSPEEVAKLQKENCIFCQIIAGKIPAQKVYDDKSCVAILDINPACEGHVLLLPKEHYPVMPLMPEETVKKMSIAAQKISNALLSGLSVEGTTLFAANTVVPSTEKPDSNAFDIFCTACEIFFTASSGIRGITE